MCIISLPFVRISYVVVHSLLSSKNRAYNPPVVAGGTWLKNPEEKYPTTRYILPNKFFALKISSRPLLSVTPSLDMSLGLVPAHYP
jgi:hypothetical protein